MPVSSSAPIRIEGLSHSFGHGPVLQNLSLTVEEKDFLAVIGPNGSGKTTLIRLMLGLTPAQAGTVRLFGEDVRRFRDWPRIGYIPQKYAVERNFPGTVGELLSLRRGRGGERALALVGVESLRNRMFLELSGGQQQRVLMAMALQSKPSLLILDEPTVGVDMKALQDFYRLLGRLNQEEGVAILLVTHDVGPISRYARHVLCLNCSVSTHGPAERTHELLREVYGPDFDLDHGHHHHGHDHANPHVHRQPRGHGHEQSAGPGSEPRAGVHGDTDAAGKEN